jgi:hypothetical protein
MEHSIRRIFPPRKGSQQLAYCAADRCAAILRLYARSSCESRRAAKGDVPPVEKRARRCLRLLWLLPAPLAFLALHLCGRAPHWVEGVFSRVLYPLWAVPISRLFALTDAPVAERLLPWLLGLCALALAAGVIRAARVRSPLPLLRWLYRLLCGLGAAYAAFVLLWGLHFARLPLAEAMALPDADEGPAALSALCNALLADAAALRAGLPQDATGGLQAPDAPALLAQVGGAYGALAAQYPWLAGDYAPPKLLQHGEAFSRMQIMGIFIPYTAEALLNPGIPISQLAHTACHEAAHQRGYAREAEADYLAYLACMASGRADFAYSGTLTMLRYAALSLWDADPEAYGGLARRFSPGVAADYAAQRDYWQAYQTPLAGLVSLTNQRYLQTFALHQAAGQARQRDEVVALLLAYHQKTGGPPVDVAVSDNMR